MSDFESRLRGALERREPPAGFAERVLARAAARPTNMEKPRRLWRPVWAAAAVAAMLVAAVGYREVQARRAEEAREQALTALRITAEKLNVVRAKLEAREEVNP